MRSFTKIFHIINSHGELLLLIEVGDFLLRFVKLKGKVPNCIHEGWKYVMEVFFSEHSYKHAGAPDFEVYSEGDMESDNYEMELWVPIVKAE